MKIIDLSTNYCQSI